MEVRENLRAYLAGREPAYDLKRHGSPELVQFMVHEAPAQRDEGRVPSGAERRPRPRPTRRGLPSEARPRGNFRYVVQQLSQWNYNMLLRLRQNVGQIEYRSD